MNENMGFVDAKRATEELTKLCGKRMRFVMEAHDTKISGEIELSYLGNGIWLGTGIMYLNVKFATHSLKEIQSGDGNNSAKLIINPL